MAVLAHVLRIVAPVVVTLYVLYLVVFLTTPVAVQGVALLVVGPWLATRLVDVVRRHSTHHLT